MSHPLHTKREQQVLPPRNGLEAVSSERLHDHDLPESFTLEAGPRFSLRNYIGPLFGFSIFLVSIGRRLWGNAIAWGLFLVVAATLGLTAMIRRIRCQMLSARVTFQRKGIQIERGGKIVDIELERITAMAVSQRDVYAEGRWMGTDRQVGLWYQPLLTTAADPEEHTSLLFQVTSENGPLLERYLNLIQHHLRNEAEQKLNRGEVLTGAGWRSTSEGVEFTSRSQQQDDFRRMPPAWEELSCESLHGRLRVWREGGPTPIVVLEESGRDVWLLRELILSYGRSESEWASRTQSDPLGRLLFERRATDTLRYRLWCAALMTVGSLLVIAAIVLGLLFLGRFGGRALPAMGPLVFIGVIGAVMMRSSIGLSRRAFRFYERAVRKTGLGGDQLLLLDNVDVFSFDMRRQRSYGRYTGTLVSMIFADLSRMGRGVFYSLTVPHIDEELEELRDRVSSHLAARMARTLGHTGHMQWTPELWFKSDRLLYRPRGWFGTRSKGIEIPYTEICRVEEADGSIHIWTEQSEKPVLKVKTNSPNYYPGLIVFERLLTLRGGGVSVQHASTRSSGSK